MKIFLWDASKNDWLKEKRGVCFEEIVQVFNNDEVIEFYDHPNPKRYPGQKIAVVSIKEYAYLVPYVQKEEEIFFKTIIPSRKATKKYLGGDYEKSDT
jgi:uncharacterized DUF497 family protein